MFNVVFPKYTEQRYYNIHFKYVLNILKELECDISYEEVDGFVVRINKKTFLFDYSDTNIVVNTELPVFKFHCHEETDNVFSFSPVSFHNWSQYKIASESIKYHAEGELSHRQRCYGNALQRRVKLRAELIRNYDNVRLTQVSQIKYFHEIDTTYLAVFCPGWCNNMLDRAQFQYMGLGCCTVSPKIPEVLPFETRLEPGVHYICCKDDYSDILDIIEEYKSKKEECIKIGQNAKELFQQTSVPRRLGEWIKKKL